MSGNFALWRAVSTNDLIKAGTALENGADPNACGPRGFSMLHIAAEKDNNQMADLLIRHGAWPSQPRAGGAIVTEMVLSGALSIATNQMLQKYPDDVTPLEIAADRQNIGFIKLVARAYQAKHTRDGVYSPDGVEQDFSRAIKQSYARGDRETYHALQDSKFDILQIAPQPQPGLIEGITQKIRHGWKSRYYATRSINDFPPSRSP